MSDLFDEEDDLVASEGFDATEEEIDFDMRPATTLDARRRLENLLEEKRLREELDDFTDY